MSMFAHALDTIREASHHKFRVLTEHSSQLLEYNALVEWPDNLSLGMNIDNADNVYRIGMLQQINIKSKFVSFSPVLGPVWDLDLDGIDWVSIDGRYDRGNFCDECDPAEWIDMIIDNCESQSIPYHFIQDEEILYKEEI